LAGGHSTYFVYKGYKAKLGEIESKIPDEDKRVETMSQIGGFHQWVVWIYGAFVAIIALCAVGIIAALANA
jgi:hypothetical protein